MPRAKLCPDCDCPMLPPRTAKKPDHYDHASGCPLAGTHPCSDCRTYTDAGPCPGCGLDRRLREAIEKAILDDRKAQAEIVVAQEPKRRGVG